jgi:hypothetical protein
MKKGTRFVGLDVRKDTIAVAVAERGGEVRSLGTIPGRDRVKYQRSGAGHLFVKFMERLDIPPRNA